VLDLGLPPSAGTREGSSRIGLFRIWYCAVRPTAAAGSPAIATPIAVAVVEVAIRTRENCGPYGRARKQTRPNAAARVTLRQRDSPPSVGVIVTLPPGPPETCRRSSARARVCLVLAAGAPDAGVCQARPG
jgi:hypothetical protein